MLPPSRRGDRLPAAIWALGFVSLLMDVSSEMIHSLLPMFMVNALGASALAVGFIEGAAEATALVVKVFSGVLSDVVGERKWLAVLGYALGAATKPLFALAPSLGVVLTARLTDRVGKGMRGAPRDALVADLAPARHARRRLRPAPVARHGRRVRRSAAGGRSDAALGRRLPRGVLGGGAAGRGRGRAAGARRARAGSPAGGAGCASDPAREPAAARAPYAWVVTVGGLFTLARFSEAFLVLRAQETGIAVAWVPLVMVAMNVVYALTAYPFGRLADRASHSALLVAGLLVLIGADVVLATRASWPVVVVGVLLWGLHLGITQGLLATMVADTAPADLRGTAFGVFNLVSGVAMLVASAIAGELWDRYGAPATFHAGAVFAAIAIVAVGLGARDVSGRRGAPPPRPAEHPAR